VFLSSDHAQSWQAVSTGLTYPFVFSLAVHDSTLFAGTYAGGVWHRPLAEMITSVKAVRAPVPQHASLEQNFPNPFNPGTVIEFSIPRRVFVSLKIYDLLGREMATLVSGELDAGRHSAQWLSGNNAAGVYFYRLQTGRFFQTRKLLLVK
jgi:hypothetical protein